REDSLEEKEAKKLSDQRGRHFTVEAVGVNQCLSEVKTNIQNSHLSACLCVSAPANEERILRIRFKLSTKSLKRMLATYKQKHRHGRCFCLLKKTNQINSNN
ncbi:hypothetical protein, partial [Parendozoicomonas sp. Alg238-R29]|uniref:hypothetical protein n=1 Tax=Parendozoicomonas sp. Alg238-R29 TaxID=2993446 RepID=UPI00248F35A8